MVMKKSTILMLMVTLAVVTGCDFFRKLAGRPTSEDIEEKRVAIMRAEEAAHQARQDSIRMEHQKVVDSLAMMDSIRQHGGSILDPDSLGGLVATKLEARYYIVVGSFRSRANAESLLATASSLNYAPALITFRNGLIAVGVSPADNLTDAYASLKKVRQEKFCPSDVWILVNE
jgi:hypothetical protein